MAEFKDYSGLHILHNEIFDCLFDDGKSKIRAEFDIFLYQLYEIFQADKLCSDVEVFGHPLTKEALLAGPVALKAVSDTGIELQFCLVTTYIRGGESKHRWNVLARVVHEL